MSTQSTLQEKSFEYNCKNIPISLKKIWFNVALRAVPLYFYEAPSLGIDLSLLKTL